MTKQKDAASVVQERPGQSNAHPGAEHVHIVIVLVNDRPGSVDRVVGLLRRRRASMQTLVIGRSEVPGMMRITTAVNDSEVGHDYLLEQLRKVVDVQDIVNISSEQAVVRELALVKVNSTATTCSEIIELGHLFGAHPVDMSDGTITLEVTGSEEKVEKLLSQLRSYGVRDVARSGCIAMICGARDV